MSKPNILQLGHGFIEGGSERQMIQMMSLLRDSGEFEVHVAALRGGGVLRSEVERLQIPVSTFRSPASTIRAWSNRPAVSFLT